MILMDSSWHPQIMHLQIHYLNLCSGKFLWAYFFTINNLSLQQSILYDIIVYMALNKTFNVFHVSIKTIPRKAKHFIRWNPLNYQPDLWQIVNTRNLSIRYLTLQAGIIFMQNYLSYNPIKNHTLRIINPFYLSILTTPLHTTKSIFDEYTLLNIENHI